MLDARGEQIALQRVRGRARVGLDLRRGATRLTQLHQAGSAKAMLPRVSGAPEIVFLNTAGGVTGGDRLDYALELGAGARATGTTQTAERAYASPGGAPGRVEIRLSVGAGGRLDWLPQETILFEDSDLERRTSVDLTGDAALLMCETLVLGRAAMGERVARARLTDRREIRRDGRPVLTEPVSLDAASLASGVAGLDGARALATVLLVAPGAEDAAAALRRVLAHRPVEAAVSGWEGRCVARLRAAEAWPLRQAVAAVLTHLREAPLPRVWQI